MKVLLVYAHPVQGSFTSAVRDHAMGALARGGHQVDLLDLHADGFDPVLSLDERLHHRQGLTGRPAIADHARRLKAADALLFVYPTWWGGPPAMLKGWFDRVWTEGVVYTVPEGSNRMHGRLHNLRRVIVVTTHGSSKWTNALQGEPGKRLIGRGLRPLVHPLARTRWIALYGIDRAGDAARAAFLDQVDRRLARPRL